MWRLVAWFMAAVLALVILVVGTAAEEVAASRKDDALILRQLTDEECMALREAIFSHQPAMVVEVGLLVSTPEFMKTNSFFVVLKCFDRRTNQESTVFLAVYCGKLGDYRIKEGKHRGVEI